jgi:hypothetical protein
MPAAGFRRISTGRLASLMGMVLMFVYFQGRKEMS